MTKDAPDGAVFERADATRTELLVEMMREFYAFEHLPWDEAEARRGLGMILGDGSLGEVWLIRRGPAVAGYFVLAFGFSLEFRGRDAFLDEIYLREEHRGGGLGRAAIAHAEEVCRARGVRALHLEVERKNTGAQAFYRALGFRDHDRYLLTKWVGSEADRRGGLDPLRLLGRAGRGPEMRKGPPAGPLNGIRHPPPAARIASMVIDCSIHFNPRRPRSEPPSGRVGRGYDALPPPARSRNLLFRPRRFPRRRNGSANTFSADCRSPRESSRSRAH